MPPAAHENEAGTDDTHRALAEPFQRDSLYSGAHPDAAGQRKSQPVD